MQIDYVTYTTKTKHLRGLVGDKTYPFLFAYCDKCGTNVAPPETIAHNNNAFNDVYNDANKK